MIPIEAFRLGKEPINGKLRLLKVRLSNATQRSAILRKVKLLKGSEKFKEIFCTPAIPLLRELIFVAYMTLCGQRKMRQELIIIFADVDQFPNGQLR